MKNSRVNVDGTETRVLSSGDDGPSVLLLHGLSARADRWVNNIDSIANEGYRVHALDLPGHGQSSPNPHFDFSLSGYCRWVSSFIEYTVAKPVHLVGTSFGGFIAAGVAIARPELLASITLVGAIGLVPVGLERRLRTKSWLKQMRPENIHERLENGLERKDLITNELIMEDYETNNGPGKADAFEKLAKYYEESLDDDATIDGLKTINGKFPISFIWGAHDRSVSVEYGTTANSSLPGSTFDLIEGAGHFPYWEQPDAFNTVLLNRMNGRDLAGGMR